MYKVGITGGIGSGKSTICKVFKSLGIAVYDADARGKLLLRENDLVKERVIKAFGTEAYNDDGSVNTAYLSEQIFENKESLNILNGIVHPAVRADFIDWLEGQSGPYVLKEAAILIESGSHEELDQIIVVEASEESRLARVMKRDGVDESKVRDRMAAQLSDEERKPYANFTIDNNDDTLVIPQILQIHEDIIGRSSS